LYKLFSNDARLSVSYVFTAMFSLCHNIIQNSLTSVDINYVFINSARITWCWLVNWDIVVSNNLHHSLLRPFHLTEGDTATGTVPVCH